MFRLHAQSVRWTAIAVFLIAGCSAVPSNSFFATKPSGDPPMGTMLAVKLTGPTAADDGTYHSRIYDSNETIIVDNAGDFSLSNGAGSVDQHNLDTSGLGPGEYKVVIYKDMYSGEDSDEDVPYSTVDFTITAPY